MKETQVSAQLMEINLLGSQAHEIKQFADSLSKQLLAKKLKIATAESCTGGGLSALLTAFAGSSNWFDRGFVTYSNQSKQDMLGVRQKTLQQCGAVSEQAAAQMALGALLNSEADCAISITGIAGPSGGSAEKPVGLVCFGWASRKGHNIGLEDKRHSEQHVFKGSRGEVRSQSLLYALKIANNLAK